MNLKGLGLALALCGLASSAPADILIDLEGDEDNFGYGGSADIPCSFYDLHEDAAELAATFDMELSGGDEVGTWTHSFTLPAGSTILSATLEVPEWFSDFTASTISLDGDVQDFTQGMFSTCAVKVVHSFNVNIASLMDGVLNVIFNENGDDIALDFSRLTIEFAPAAAAPEPGTLLLLGAGALGLLRYGRRRTS